MKKVDLFTDGSCSGNPGPGGWGVLMRYGGHERELSGGDTQTTNNRMELMAAIEGLAALKSPCTVTIHTDSKYVMDGVQEHMDAWKARGWKTSAKKEVKNLDLWQRLDAEMARHKIKWIWVKGHSGHVENERVDKIAKAATPHT